MKIHIDEFTPKDFKRLTLGSWAVVFGALSLSFGAGTWYQSQYAPTLVEVSQWEDEAKRHKREASEVSERLATLTIEHSALTVENSTLIHQYEELRGLLVPQNESTLQFVERMSHGEFITFLKTRELDKAINAPWEPLEPTE